MPRADTPCAGCGKLLQSGPNSLPAGQRMCHPCRRAKPAPYGSRTEPIPARACELCEESYVPKYGRQRFCSKPCADKSGRGSPRVMDKACEICGEQFKPSDRLNRGGSGYVQRTCGRACGVELRRREHGTAGREPARWPSCPIWARECAHCGALFIARRFKQVTCAPACGRKLGWAKSNAARRATEHICPCGIMIPPSRNKCDACVRQVRKERKRKERARKRDSIASEPYTLAQIAARDRYRCGICIAEGNSRQARVAMTKAVPHPKAPTIDHVIPWSISRDDTRANVQLAHFICNSRKHVRGSQQLALIG